MDPGPDPRRCPRCDTPHHPECWEYVPGCAIFGCAESAANLATDAWSEAHQALLWRVRCVTCAAHAFQVLLVSFAVIIVAGSTGVRYTPPWLLWLFLGSCLVTIVAIVAGGDQQDIVRLRFLLKRTESEGNRRLARAVEARAGRMIPIPSWLFSTCLTACVVYSSWRALVSWGELLCTGAMAFLGFYATVLWISTWVGQQRILVHRLQASVGSGKPVE